MSCVRESWFVRDFVGSRRGRSRAYHARGNARRARYSSSRPGSPEASTRKRKKRPRRRSLCGSYGLRFLDGGVGVVSRRGRPRGRFLRTIPVGWRWGSSPWDDTGAPSSVRMANASSGTRGWRRACARAMVSHSVGGGASGGDARSRRAPPLGPNLDARRRRYRPEAVFVHGTGVRGNPLALAKSNPDAYAYPTPFALSPAFTPDAERLRDVLGSDGPVYFLPGG